MALQTEAAVRAQSRCDALLLRENSKADTLLQSRHFQQADLVGGTDENIRRQTSYVLLACLKVTHLAALPQF